MFCCDGSYRLPVVLSKWRFRATTQAALALREGLRDAAHQVSASGMVAQQTRRA